jgi:tetratricopeptide (TPR) repeat protein
VTADEAKQRLDRRITQSATQPQMLLEPAAIHDASAIEEALAASSDDIDGGHILGVFYLLRSQLLPPAQATQYTVAGVRWMAHVFVRDPDRVPEDMLSGLAVHAPPAGNEPREWYIEALRLIGSEASENNQVLDRAVKLLEAASAHEAAGDLHALCLSTLGLALRTRYQRSRQDHDLQRAIEVGEEALRAVTDTTPTPQVVASDLATSRLVRFDATHDVPDLERSVALLSDTVRAMPPSAGRYEKYQLFDALMVRFGLSGDLDDLERAISAGADTLRATPEDHPMRVATLSDFAGAHLTRFEQTGDAADLDQAVGLLDEAVPVANPSELPLVLSQLCHGLTRRHLCRNRPTDLDRAVHAGREAVATAEPDNSLSQALRSLGNAVLVRYEIQGQIGDLNEAADLGRSAVVTSADQPERWLYVHSLGAAFLARSARSAALADTDAAIAAFDEALTLAPARDRLMPATMLARTLLIRFEHTRDRADLDHALELLAPALAAVPAGSPLRTLVLSTLGMTHFHRFGLGEGTSDLDRAVDLLDEAVRRTSTTDSLHAETSAVLGTALALRFAQARSVDDLNRGVAALRSSVHTAPSTDPHRPTWLAQFGSALVTRYSQTGEMGDLNDALSTLEEAAATSPADHAHHDIILSSLAHALLMRFERFGSPDDLDRATAVADEAVLVAPSNNNARRISCLGVQGLAQLARHTLVASADDLDRAVSALSYAVEHTAVGHLGREEWLHGLGIALRMRSQQTASGLDLDRAIHLLSEAVATTGLEHASRPRIQSNLGVALMDRFLQSSVRSDLERAIATLQAAVDATPPRSPQLQMHLMNLASALRLQIGGLLARQSLDRAVDTMERTLAATSEDDTNRAVALYTLGSCLHLRFERFGNTADLDRAIGLLERASAAVPETYYASGNMLIAAGAARRSRYARSGEVRDSTTARETFRQVARLLHAPVSVRIQAASLWAQAAAEAAAWPESRSAWSEALDQLPQVVGRHLDRPDRQRLLRLLQDMGTGAAAAHAEAGDAWAGWQALEQGRGVLLGQALDLAVDPELRDVYPDLARRADHLRQVLNRDQSRAPQHLTAGSSTGVSDQGKDTGKARAAALREWDGLTADIRARPGFEGFGQPPTIAELRGSVSDGHIVAINVSPVRCDAFVLSASHDTAWLPLPTLRGHGSISCVYSC